jgi:hypothetical protein
MSVSDRGVKPARRAVMSDLVVCRPQKHSAAASFAAVGCVAAPRAGDPAAIVDCAVAPSWQLDDAGALRSTDGPCLTVDATGEIVARACGALGAGGRFFLDDEGHLWSGVVPPPLTTMNHAELYCVGQDAGRPYASLCSAGFARGRAATGARADRPAG